MFELYSPALELEIDRRREVLLGSVRPERHRRSDPDGMGDAGRIALAGRPLVGRPADAPACERPASARTPVLGTSERPVPGPSRP
jgi:hypothetical protein